MARAINEITVSVINTAVDFDLSRPPENVQPTFTGAPSTFLAAPDPPTPRIAPAFPPGLGYDSPQALARVAQGDVVVGRGFGFDPPLIPPIPTMPRAMMAVPPPERVVDPTVLVSLWQRAQGRKAAIEQAASQIRAETSLNPPTLSTTVTDQYPTSAVTGVSNDPRGTATMGPSISTQPRHSVPDMPATEVPPSSTQEMAPAVVEKPRMTYAKVAAIPVPKHAKTDPTTPHSTEPTPAANTDGAVNPNTNEPILRQQRVVWIRGCSKDTTLRFISEQIHEGALLSLLFDVDPINPEDANSRAACVIFHQAKEALRFIQANQVMVNMKGHCRYGPRYSIEPGLPWPADDQIRWMDSPRRQRRRITISGARLFGRVSRYRFAADVRKVAGEHNVELIWLYNMGNATIVLASVKVARAVRDYFLDRAKGGPPYEGVAITFSSDPCEAPLNFRTQLKDGEL